MAKGLELDFDTADSITRLNLKDSYDYLVKEMEEYEADPKAKWMHPEDYHNSKFNLIPALTIVLNYYGTNI